MKTKLTLAAAFIAALGCARGADTSAEDPGFGKPQQQSAVQNAGSTESKSASLTCDSKEKCPKADLEVKVVEGKVQGQVLIGLVDEKSEFTLELRDKNGAGRKGLIIVDNLVDGADFEYDSSASNPDHKAKITLPRLTKRKTDGKNMTLIVRDMELCESQNETKSKCREEEYASAYDKKFDLAWKILTEKESDDPSSVLTDKQIEEKRKACENQKVVQGANGQINTIGAGANILTGIIGNNPGAIIQGAAGILTGQISSSAQAKVLGDCENIGQ